MVAAHAAELRAAGEEVTVTVVTDGKPTDGDLAEALDAMAGLPVRLTVRLCTDGPEALDYWQQLEAAATSTGGRTRRARARLSARAHG